MILVRLVLRYPSGIMMVKEYGWKRSSGLIITIFMLVDIFNGISWDYIMEYWKV